MPDRPPAPTASVPLVSRRRERAQVMQRLQHAVPAAALLYAGIDGLRHGVRGGALALACVEIAASALLLRTLFTSARRALSERLGKAGAAHEAAIDWGEVLAGLVLLVEVAERWYSHAHLARPTLLLGIITVGLGFAHGRLAAGARKRRRLDILPTGIAIRGRLRRFSATWQEIERFEIADADATVVTRQGRRRRLDFTDLQQADAVRAALESARERWREHALGPALPPAAG